MYCVADDGGVSSHMAPSCCGGQLDRRNGVSVGCGGADTQARTVHVTEDIALSGHGPPIPGSGLGSDRGARIHRPSVTASARDSNRGSIEMADNSGNEVGLVTILLFLTLTHDLIIGPRVAGSYNFPRRTEPGPITH